MAINFVPSYFCASACKNTMIDKSSIDGRQMLLSQPPTIKRIVD